MTSKYAPLGAYLRAQRLREVPMTFAEIERIVGTKLPASAQKHRPWWSNNAGNSVMTRVWLDAGYRTEQVDMASQRLIFKRESDLAPSVESPPTAPPPNAGGRDNNNKGHHPLFGALKGLASIAPGVDLTEPADPNWGTDAWKDEK